MRSDDAKDLLADLAGAFGKRMSSTEAESWYRYALAELHPEKAKIAVTRCIQSLERFPTVSQFRQIADQVRLGGGGMRLVELFPGEWVTLEAAFADQERDRDLELTPERRLENRIRLAEVSAAHFGTPWPKGLPHAAPRDDLFELDEPF